MFCSHCGHALDVGAAGCSACGVVVAAHEPRLDDAASLFGDTIRFPQGPEGESGQPFVRPALAILFRLAVGPAADYYAPRFLAYERAGHGMPSWHWPSLLVPSVWAFYRKLWLPGVAFSLLPVAGALAFAAIGPRIDDSALLWFACAALVIWILPGIIPAVFANSLLYSQARRLIQDAETQSGNASQAASLLTAYRPTSFGAALLLGGGVLALALGGLAPHLSVSYAEHAVRAKVGESLAAVRWLQNQVEEQWTGLQSLSLQPDGAATPAHGSSTFFDDVSVSPTNGRLRLDVGPSIPELSGKVILLAPAIDVRQRVHWMCIPIDIPQKYLPRECRNG